MDESKIIALIVIYNPDLKTLVSIVENVANQVFAINIIDNSANELSDNTIKKINLIACGKLSYNFNNNIGGIARAQNIGIKKAIERKADFVLFLDQDSLPDLHMSASLKEDFFTLTNAGYKLAAIGPNPINMHSGVPYDDRVYSKDSVYNSSFINVSELQNSGSLISTEVFKDVGLMDETLFIDGVDHEWCWRASTRGYICILTKNTELQHMLGEGDRYLLGMRVAISSPIRIYYQFRNYIYLCSKKYVPYKWKLKNGFKYIVKVFYYSLFVSPRLSYLKNMLQGITAGLSLLRNSNN